MIAFGILLGLTGVILLIAGAAQAVQNRTFAGCTQSVAAEVLRKNSRHGKNQRIYELLVRYTVDGVVYEKRIGVTATEYNSITVGAPYTVKYRPNAPQKAVRPESLNPKNVRVILILGAALLAAGVVLFCIGRLAA